MLTYRERQTQNQIKLLHLQKDSERLIVRPPRYWLGFGIGCLVAVLVFLGGSLPDLLPTPSKPEEQKTPVLPGGEHLYIPQPRIISHTEGNSRELRPMLVGGGSVILGFLTAFVTARIFRNRIVLDRRNDRLIFGNNSLGSLTRIEHVGQAKYRTVASRVPVTHYQLALFFRDGIRKPLLICETDSSDVSGLAKIIADFLHVDIRDYEQPVT